MPDLSLVPPAFGYVLAGVFGAIIGSFLNVVIHRVPLEQSIVFPNSRCPSCGAVIAFYDNIPVISWMLLGAKCRGCKQPISFRYPAVELLTAALFVAVAWHDGPGVVLLFDLVFVSALIALMFIDAAHQILPDVITLPGIAFALVARITIPLVTGLPHFDDLPSLMNGSFSGLPVWLTSVLGAVIGGLIGGGSLWLMGWTWEKLRKVEAMGLGDVKMMFMVGGYLGWRLTILTLFMGVLSGSVIGILLMVVERQFDSKKLLPFGVFLGIGTIVALLFGSQIVDWYAGQFRL
ncbi:MAG TPA: prepilin peptidase [Pyrinomonadaceae bacterium]|nr:prepilin peptidase [Pyrinomonadaceae bacterium]